MSMGKTYAYYPGCSGLGTSEEYERSTRSACDAIGMNLKEIPDWSCCGSTPAHTVDHTLSSALSARNLTLAEDLGAEAVITPCPSCLTNLKNAAHALQDPSKKERISNLLETPARSTLPVKSVLQVVFEDIGPDAIKSQVVKPLKGLKVACYYGCIMNRPPEVMQFDDHENPISMGPHHGSARRRNCTFPLKGRVLRGASYGVARREVVTRLSGKLLDMAVGLGANAIVTACPLCQMNLDMRQGQINFANKTRYKIPVFYYTQLMGLALGVSEDKIGFDKLCVSPKEVLRTISAS